MNGIDLILANLRYGINQPSDYFTPNDHVRQTMHPDLLYIIAQQHAEQLRRPVEHSRLSRGIQRMTIAGFNAWRWSHPHSEPCTDSVSLP